MSSHVPWQNGRWLTGTRHASFAVLLPAATIPPAARRWRFADAGVPMLALLATARTRTESANAWIGVCYVRM